jgi:TetR/AcrR family transcriptional repressor of nem operon
LNDQPTKPKADTRERIVEAARCLFFEQGYTATGISQILARAEVNSGSLYYFFPTKEDLLIAVLERYKSMLEPAVLTPAYARAVAPLERLFAVLDGYRRLLQSTDFHLGCPIGNLALEMSNSHPQVRRLVVENFEAWRAAIRQLVEQAKDRLPEDVDANVLAHSVLATMEGAVMLSRAYHSFEPFDCAVASLRDHFDRLVADGSNWSSPQQPRETRL